ncbi:MAG: nucleotide sugar dehydrogenase [Candidatus Aminicenantales bacterium]
MKKNIGVIGLWHLGCVIAASWSKLGHRVYGVDFDPSRISRLQQGIPPIYEPMLETEIKRGISSNKLSFSTELETLRNCDYVFLAYDTPVGDDDASDISILENSVIRVRNILKNGSILIISSQSPIGFCTHLREELTKINKTLDLAYSPENLRLGAALECYMTPGRIILGANSVKAEKKCRQLFQEIADNIISMNLESAELVKHGINSFLATSIVFANGLSDICESHGARIDDVIKGMKSDPRIGEKAYLTPGIGFSGGTLGRDLMVLSRQDHAHPVGSNLFGYVIDLNRGRINGIVSKIKTALGEIEGARIGILGLTYKPGTSTLRRSLPMEIAGRLVQEKAMVSAYDPKADYEELSAAPAFHVGKNIPETAKDSDLLVLLTEWEEFKQFDWSSIKKEMRRPIFFDTKNCLDEDQMKKIGFRYISLGRG